MKGKCAILFLVIPVALATAAPIYAGKSDGRTHWSFQPLKRPAIPAGEYPVDAFISAKLREQNLTQNAPARPRELIRRAYFDLIGLPPSPQEVTAFENNPSPTAFEKVIDRL